MVRRVNSCFCWSISIPLFDKYHVTYTISINLIQITWGEPFSPISNRYEYSSKTVLIIATEKIPTATVSDLSVRLSQFLNGYHIFAQQYHLKCCRYRLEHTVHICKLFFHLLLLETYSKSIFPSEDEASLRLAPTDQSAPRIPCICTSYEQGSHLHQLYLYKLNSIYYELKD